MPDPEANDVGITEIPETGVLRRRWYILAVLSGLILMQSVVWNTFQPLSRSVFFVFGWKKDFLGALSVTAVFGFFLSLYPWLAITHKFGVRVTCLCFSASLTLISIVNCFASIFLPKNYSGFFVVAQSLNGLLTSLLFVLPTYISSLWFSKSERAIATSIGAVASYVGVSLSALVGPAIVTQPTIPAEWHRLFSCSPLEGKGNLWNKVHREIVRLLIGQATICFLLLFLVTVHFPARPPRPPCPSATFPRLNVVQGFREIVRNRNIFFLSVAYGTSAGTALSWISVFDINLASLGFTQAEAGVATSLSLLAGFLASLPIARIAGFLKTKHKALVLSCRLISLLPLTIVLLASTGTLRIANQWITICVCFTVAPLIGSENLFYEMAAEMAFPASEMDTSVPLATAFNIFVLFFFLIMILPIGTIWMNWAVVVAITLSLPFIIFTKVDYLRLQAEEEEEEEGEEEVEEEGRDVAVPETAHSQT